MDKAKLTPTDVGKYFYSLNNDLTDMQIQKLVYYAYAWYMIKNGEARLFDESPEAWEHGPVFRSLYDDMKSDKFKENNNEVKKISPNIKNFLSYIYVVYGKYSGNELENMTHSELPWQKARRKQHRRFGKSFKNVIQHMNFNSAKSRTKILDDDILLWGASIK